MPHIAPRILDAALQAIVSDSDRFVALSDYPASYAQIATYALGTLAVTGASFLGPEVSADGYGRRVRLQAFSGGVAAVFHNRRFGLVDNWLRHIHDTQTKYHALLASVADESARLNRLCELNVIDQIFSAAQTTVIQDAWARGQSVTVHGWVYDLHDGLLHSLGLEVSSADDLQQQSQAVFQRMAQS